MKYLTREEIFKAADSHTEDVEIELWGGTVRVTELDAQYVTRLIKSGFIQKDPVTGEQEPRLEKIDFVEIAARSIVDENGQRIMSKQDAEALGQKSWDVIALIAKTALRLSGLAQNADEVDETEGQDGEGSEKNED